ncbi:MAG: PKD domain-containing protein, partial [Bacteroidota bacterium]
TRRDFQFNVTECVPKVVAQITADSMVNRTNSFFLEVCGTDNITFQNESFSRANVQSFFWEFDLQGDTLKIGTWNATVSFPEVGEYTGRLVLNPNTDCGDTARFFVEVKPEIRADFDFEYDTCLASPVVFQDQSFSGSMQLTDWQWSFGDGDSSSLSNPTHSYDEVGEMMVNLRVEDINSCVADTTKILRYFPVPEEIIIDPSTFQGCNPQFIFFDNLSEPITEAYDINWDFGDGGTSTAISPSYVYEAPGVYDVSLEIVSPIGCRTSRFYENWITVLPSPVADFSYNPEQHTIKIPKIGNGIQGLIIDIDARVFYGMLTSTEFAPSHTFPDTGLQQITLIVTHQSGCQDTLIQFVDIPPEIFIYIPNAFSPNGQGDPENEFFRPVGILPGVRQYRMMIWDRWGNLLFTSNDISTPWNGADQSNEPLPQGVYVYIVEFIGPRGESYKYAGDVTLLR